MIQTIWNKWTNRTALQDYAWHIEMERLFAWLQTQSSDMHSFIFDVMMSLAYVETTSNVADILETCPNTLEPYNAQIGFINLCSSCYINQNQWKFQKAAKPSSGALGKISSEMVLKFIEQLNPYISASKIVGGTETVDAALLTYSGQLILAEIKSAPLLTYPILFRLPENTYSDLQHQSVEITQSQLKECDTALFLQNGTMIPLGKMNDKNWPFQTAIDFICKSNSLEIIENAKDFWLSTKQSYITKDKAKPEFYLTNACGKPPINALQQGWPKKETISDSKTSAGLDRTDDIKKGIYQTFKIATEYANNPNIKTALISNLPAYRHHDEYIANFVMVLWGNEQDLQNEVLPKAKLNRVFDYIITLDTEHSILRGEL